MWRTKIVLLAGMVLVSGALLTGCPTANGYAGEVVFPQINFDQMLGLQPIPGDLDHALVVTKDGMLRRASLTDDAEAPTVFMDIRDKIIANPDIEEGLLGLAYAPDYVSSGRFYLYYSAGNPRRAVIARFLAHGARADPASERVVLEIGEPFPNHNGGALAFGPDGLLYVGVGDGGSAGDPQNNGQNANVLLGKILRIDVSGDGYTIPPGNPFASDNGRGEVYAYGFRNPWRINFDRATGQLWAGDVGQNEWEEVDRIAAGGDYGWRLLEGNHCYNPDTNCDAAGLIPPRVEYSHDYGCSITGGFVYRGSRLPELDGWYVYGDYCSGRVWAVDTSAEAGPAIPLADVGAGITSFAQDRDGELYIVSFNHKILKLTTK